MLDASFQQTFEQQLGKHALAVGIAWGREGSVTLTADLGLLLAYETRFDPRRAWEDTHATAVADYMAADIHMGVLARIHDKALKQREASRREMMRWNRPVWGPIQEGDTWAWAGDCTKG